jgi:hypothetical protein
MGVLYDYFRAPDDDAAAAVADRPGGPLTSNGAVFDGVVARGIDPIVTLGQLLAFVRGVTWNPELVEADQLARAADRQAWVERLGELARDGLADAADEALPEIVVKWSQAEDFCLPEQADGAQLLALVTDLVGLARRARAADQLLYCWCCLAEPD